MFATYCGFDYFISADDVTWFQIFYNLRLPRGLAVVFTGAILALSGLLVQNIFQNPLASPSVLGFEAMVVSMLVTFVLVGLEFNTGLFWSFYIASFLGMILIYFLMLKKIQNQSPVKILLVGFSVNAFASAWSLFCSSFAKDKFESLVQIQALTMGSFQGKTYSDAAALILIGMPLFFFVQRRSFVIDMLTQGAEISGIQGLKPHRIYFQILFLVAICVTVAVTFGTALPFVGLIIPQLVRYVRPTLKQALIPVASLGGVLSLTADFLAQRIFYPRQLEAGVITALIGAPFFLWIMLASRDES